MIDGFHLPAVEPPSFCEATLGWLSVKQDRIYYPYTKDSGTAHLDTCS